MGDLAIDVRGLKKSYPLLPDRKSWGRLILRPTRGFPRFTALRNVSFQLTRGSALGVVGDNGAGKSTLLKILCGATSPSTGKAQVAGTIGALLELGTGFHPEFSGRENIHFSAALLGLTRAEVRAFEPDIIDFSELGSAIDEPVRTYSSGMSLRLAFAVATGFSPDVLVIDEALSVGDQVFQKKCTDRIKEFQDNGTTIVFCSHNLTQVKSLCDEALWLDKASVVASGRANRVVVPGLVSQKNREFSGNCPPFERSGCGWIWKLDRTGRTLPSDRSRGPHLPPWRFLAAGCLGTLSEASRG